MTIPPAQMGPAMRALSPSKRAFVEAKLQQPDITHVRAAIIAGYTGTQDSLYVTGKRLAHDDQITKAIIEETERRMVSLLPLSLATIEAVMGDETQPGPTRLKAAFGLMDRGGLPVQTKQSIQVEKIESSGEQVERIARLAKLLGKDPRELLGQAGVALAPTIEGEAEDDLADIL